MMKKKIVLGSWATTHLPALGRYKMELYRDTACMDGQQRPRCGQERARHDWSGYDTAYDTASRPHGRAAACAHGLAVGVSVTIQSIVS